MTNQGNSERGGGHMETMGAANFMAQSHERTFRRITQRFGSYSN